VRRADILAKYQYTTGMLNAITPIIDEYVAEGGDKQRLIVFIGDRFEARDSIIEKKIASARDVRE
jgi:hypothetical protein